MPVKTKRVCESPSLEDGTHILVTRFYLRGVKRKHFHEWLKELGNAPELIKAWKAGHIT